MTETTVSAPPSAPAPEPVPSLEEVHEEWKEIVIYNVSRGMKPEDIFSFPDFLVQQFSAAEIEEMLSGPPVDVWGIWDVLEEQQAMEADDDEGCGEECQ